MVTRNPIGTSGKSVSGKSSPGFQGSGAANRTAHLGSKPNAPRPTRAVTASSTSGSGKSVGVAKGGSAGQSNNNPNRRGY